MRNIGFDKINSIVKNKIIERYRNSIYDSCIRSLFRGIEINENNKLFKLLYVNKLTSIYVNLDSKSYLKIKSEKNKNGEIEVKSRVLNQMKYFRINGKNTKTSKMHTKILYTEKRHRQLQRTTNVEDVSNVSVQVMTYKQEVLMSQ